jgi:hypothetical protein
VMPWLILASRPPAANRTPIFILSSCDQQRGQKVQGKLHQTWNARATSPWPALCSPLRRRTNLLAAGKKPHLCDPSPATKNRRP